MKYKPRIKLVNSEWQCGRQPRSGYKVGLWIEAYNFCCYLNYGEYPDETK